VRRPVGLLGSLVVATLARDSAGDVRVLQARLKGRPSAAAPPFLV